MDARDVSRILMKAAAYDLRTVGEGDILAWHEALHDVDLDDALTAVARHYRDTNERLMPADVRNIVAELARERRRAERLAREHAEQQSLAGRPATGRRAEIDAYASGFSPPLALPSRYETDDERDRRITAGIAAVREQLPDESPAARHQRLAIARARKERGRPERQAPRRKRKPPKDWPPPQSDEIAALATRYLIDGYPPADVAERLGVSRKWCQHTNRRMRPAGQASQPEESL